MKYLLLLFTLLTMTSCPFYMDKEAGVSINNQSDNDLYMEIGLDSISSFYTPPNYVFDEIRLCKHNERKYFICTGLYWDEFFKTHNLKTISIFLLDSDTVQAYDIQTLKEEYKIKCRYDVTLKDLDIFRCTFTYPPTPEMRDIKMWPPYSTFEK